MASATYGAEEDATCNPYRVRSISLPSRSHPLALRFQEELAVLKSWSTASISTNNTTHLVTGLQALSRVYDAIENLLRMPGVRRAMAAEHARRDGRWVADELEGSVRLLDACASARDSMPLVRDAARGLQCALRTRASASDPGAALRGHARDYAARRREAAKEMGKCGRELKAISDEQQQDVDDRVAVSGGSGDQEDLSLIIGALRDSRVMAAAVLRAVLSGYAPKSAATTRPAAVGWGLVSKALLHKSKANKAAEGDDDAVEASLQAMLQKGKSSSKQQQQTGEADSLEVQRHLQALQLGATAVETGLECVFRRLVRNRADLLNVVNNI